MKLIKFTLAHAILIFDKVLESFFIYYLYAYDISVCYPKI